MPSYFVRTAADRILSITADSYLLDERGAAYNFTKDNRRVASLNYHSVVGIFEEDVFEGEVSAFDGDDPEETDNVCLDCRFEEFLKSETFTDAVFEAVDFYNQCGVTDSPEPDFVPEEESPLVEQRLQYGLPTYGVSFRNKFYPFGNRVAAESYAELVAKDPTKYTGLPLEECPLVEVTQ